MEGSSVDFKQMEGELGKAKEETGTDKQAIISQINTLLSGAPKNNHQHALLGSLFWLISAGIGVSSAVYAFDKESTKGAKLVPLTFNLPLATRQSFALAGGIGLNAALNTFFIADFLQNFNIFEFEFRLKKHTLHQDNRCINGSKACKYSAVLFFTLCSSAPFIAIARLNGKPWVIEAVAYSALHWSGSKALVIDAPTALQNKCRHKKIQKNADKKRKLFLNALKYAKKQRIENITKPSTVKNFKDITFPATFIDLSNLMSELQSQSNNPAHDSLLDKRNCGLTTTKFILGIFNEFSMIFAMMGYYCLTVENTASFLGLSDSEPWVKETLGVVAFGAFAGLVQRVIVTVTGTVVDSVSQGAPYYLKPGYMKLFAGITSIPLLMLGIYSGSVALFLNEKYLSENSLYVSYREPTNYLAVYATAFFNLYACVVIEDSLLKPLAGLLNPEIKKTNNDISTLNKLSLFFETCSDEVIDTIIDKKRLTIEV